MVLVAEDLDLDLLIQLEDGLGMGINAIAAFQHFNAGNLEGAALSGAGAAMDVGALMRNGTGAVSGAARMLGFAGAAYTGYVGVQQMIDGDYVRGGLSIATGVGAGMGIASHLQILRSGRSLWRSSARAAQRSRRLALLQRTAAEWRSPN